MRVQIDYKDALFEINQQIANMQNVLEADKKKILTKGAKVIKASVEKYLPKSDPSEFTSNYDGSLPYIHMKDDVKTSIKTDSNGNIYANIRGGKYTGWRWHLLNNGTSKMKATHFIDKALEETSSEIESLVDEAIRKAVQ